jgi:DNA polymerase III alpha subunit
MLLVELDQRLRRDDVEMPFPATTDGRLQPSLFNPVDNLALANAKNGSQAFYREEIAPNVPQAQVVPPEHVANRLGRSVELLGDLLHRPLDQFLTNEIELRIGPPSIFRLVLDAVLNDEPPTGIFRTPCAPQWPCTIEEEADGSLSMRMGLRYAKGLRKESAEAIVAARERDGRFRSTEDLALRVPLLNRKELTILARVGALNSIDRVAHRRDASWQVERAGKMEGPLFRQRSEWLQEDAQSQPLQQMNLEERLVADYGGTGLTIGKHPMYYRRHALCRQGVLTASELQKRRNGGYVKTAGLAIVKRRPGTAKGVVFMSAADETGIFNIIVSKDFF